MRKMWKFSIYTPEGAVCYSSNFDYESRYEARHWAIRYISQYYDNRYRFGIAGSLED